MAYEATKHFTADGVHYSPGEPVQEEVARSWRYGTIPRLVDQRFIRLLPAETAEAETVGASAVKLTGASKKRRKTQARREAA